VIDTTPEPASLAGLGIGFGAGNTFWTKSGGFQFRHIGFDLIASTNGLLQTFAAGQASSISLGIDPVNDLLADIVPNLNNRPIPDSLELYDVHDVVNGNATEPTLIDRDFFKTSNVNGNGTGEAVFDLAGGRLFALDTNNGLLALKVVARLFATRSAGNLNLTWTGPSALQAADVVTGSYSNVAGAASIYTTGLTNSARFFRLAR